LSLLFCVQSVVVLLDESRMACLCFAHCLRVFIRVSICKPRTDAFFHISGFAAVLCSV